MHSHDRDRHDDFGGLQRDLAATGAVMDRRGLLRLAARFGVDAGMLQILGCGGGTPTSPTTTDSTTTSGGAANSACTVIPQETAGPACDEVYALSGYESSVTNLSRVTLATDNVFSDGSAVELATVSGSTSGGTASLTVAV